MKLSDYPYVPAVRIPTGNADIDRVLGGGFVAPSVVLLEGQAGVGKTTLLALFVAGLNVSKLYVAAEHPRASFRRQMRSIGVASAALPDACCLCGNRDFAAIMREVESADPRVVVVDSLTVLVDDATEHARAEQCVAALRRAAAAHNRVVIVVAQVNTRGGMTNVRRARHHAVDTVLQLRRDGPFHVLSSPEKNRDGSVDHEAMFRLTLSGFIPREVGA